MASLDHLRLVERRWMTGSSAPEPKPRGFDYRRNANAASPQPFSSATRMTAFVLCRRVGNAWMGASRAKDPRAAGSFGSRRRQEGEF